MISSFIASELLPRYDIKLFRNWKKTNIRTNKRKIRKKNECCFNMNRLMRIYSYIYEVALNIPIDRIDIETISDVLIINSA